MIDWHNGTNVAQIKRFLQILPTFHYFATELGEIHRRRVLRNVFKDSFIDTNLIHNFYINYIKLSSSTCFERHPLIFRRSIMLIVHVCSLWYYHSVKVNYCFIVLEICYHFVKKETTTHSCFLFNKMITYSQYNKAIIHFYRMIIPEAAYMCN